MSEIEDRSRAGNRGAIGGYQTPTEEDVERAKNAWTAARAVAGAHYDEYRRLRDLRGEAFGAPKDWEPVSAPAGYRKVAGGPPWVQWLRSTFQPDNYLCTTRDQFRYATVEEALEAGWIVPDDAWMRFVNKRFPRRAA